MLMQENMALQSVMAFVDELWRAGVKHVCISPGSRSTPLTMSIVRDGRFRIWSLLDERSAGFFAVGLARKGRSPVALVCTSGTATGNYLPALMEARSSRVPLVVLTADRPPELHHVGSNQTVDQAKLYGSYTKWYVEMPVPDTNESLMRHARATAWRAVTCAQVDPAGPVHVNWPFREPLIPPAAIPEPEGEQPARMHQVFSADFQPSDEAVQTLSILLSSAQRGMIVCGPMDRPGFAEAVGLLSRKWNVPLLADALSQVRCGEHDTTNVVDTYDLMLRTPQFVDALRPDVIVRFGQAPTSKVLSQFLSQQTQARQVVVDEDPVWRDPLFTATDVVHSNPTRLCERLLDQIVTQTSADWTTLWREANQRTRGVVHHVLKDPAWFEGRVIVELNHLLPTGASLFAGNSMPVRDLDSFCLTKSENMHVLSNRGASGIDGVVSTALGVSGESREPVVLVIGDISFYHDLNGLLAASRHALNLLIVLIHNDGGGIFSFLPQASHKDTFSHFQTSHGIDFRQAVEMYHGHFERVADWNGFQSAVDAALQRTGVSVLELRTDGEENVQLHRAIFEQVRQVLQGLPVGE
jgi:2-succinyl-5-enolpyruvyl-6-hydroxy-3-cyclohexene-1-carboxylate synthase